MRIRSTILLFFGFNLVYSQKEDNNLYFGNQAALNFRGSKLVALPHSAMKATYSRSIMSGLIVNLFLYLERQIILNQNHNITLNGNGLLGGSASIQSGSGWDLFPYDLWRWKYFQSNFYAKGIKYPFLIIYHIINKLYKLLKVLNFK